MRAKLFIVEYANPAETVENTWSRRTGPGVIVRNIQKEVEAREVEAMLCGRMWPCVSVPERRVMGQCESCHRRQLAVWRSQR